MGLSGFDNTAWVKRFTADRPARALPPGRSTRAMIGAGDQIDVVHRPEPRRHRRDDVPRAHHRARTAAASCCAVDGLVAEARRAGREVRRRAEPRADRLLPASVPSDLGYSASTCRSSAARLQPISDRRSAMPVTDRHQLRRQPDRRTSRCSSSTGSRRPPHREAFRYPRRRGLGVGHLASRPATRSTQARGRPAVARHRARAAGRHRVRHPLRVDPGRPRDHVRRRRDDDGLPVDQRRGHRRTSSATPSAASSSPRTTSRSPSSRERQGRAARTSARSSPSTAPTDGDWVIGLDDLAKLGDDYLAEHPGVVEETAPAITPDQLATLIYTSGTTGRPKGVRLRHRLVGLRGRRDPGAGHPAARTTCSSCGCRWRTRSARCCSPTQLALRLRDRDRRPGRQDRRQPRRREADVHGRRAAHLREGARPDRHDAGRPRAAPRRRSSTRPSRSASRSTGSSAEGKSVPLPAQRSSTGSSTSWSSARSATASAAGSASSSPARPRSTTTSPSGSTPPAS